MSPDWPRRVAGGICAMCGAVGCILHLHDPIRQVVPQRAAVSAQPAASADWTGVNWNGLVRTGGDLTGSTSASPILLRVQHAQVPPSIVVQTTQGP